MGGLGNGDSSPSYTDIEYAFYLEVGGNLYVYESGILRGQFGTYTGTDRLKVAVEQVVVNGSTTNRGELLPQRHPAPYQQRDTVVSISG